MENGWCFGNSQQRNRVTVLSEVHNFNSAELANCNGLDVNGHCPCRTGSREASISYDVTSTGPEVVKQGSPSRKLLLHFDVRNTVLVADSVWSENVEQALNSYLCGVTWGREAQNGSWEWVSEEPSLKPPAPNVMTYYKYIEKRTVRGKSDRSILRKLTGDFTQQEVGKRFLPYFQSLLKHLEWEHSTSDDLLTMPGKDGRPYHYLLPAFLHLIQHLKQKGRDFAIIIRTYGADCPTVLAALKKTFQGGHPEFFNPIHVDVNTTPGEVRRGSGGRIQLERSLRHSNGLRIPRTEILSTERAIYTMLCAASGVSGYVDHFEYWQENDFHHQTSKPLWILPSEKKIHTIFFDDNIRAMEVDSIVDLRVLGEGDSVQGRSMTLEESAVFEDVCLVQADLLESIHNKQYFIDKLDICERNYDIVMERFLQKDVNLEQDIGLKR